MGKSARDGSAALLSSGMKIESILEKADILGDTKARRVLNTSSKKAGISADEIEAGVTIERLEALKVPVFRYATQITIHGDVEDFNEASRPAGYASIFRNKNGTVGVRYVAIDAAKKEILNEACRLAARLKFEKGERGGVRWSANISSKGLTISAMFEDKASCIAAYKAFPTECFYGSLGAFAGYYGGFFVEASVGAIPEDKLWVLINTLYGISSRDEFDRLSRELDEKDEQAAARRRQEAQDSALRMAREKSELAQTVQMPALRAIPKAPCSFVRVGHDGVKAGLYRVWLVRKGPATMRVSQQYTPGNISMPNKQGVRILKTHLDKYDMEIKQGLIFQG